MRASLRFGPSNGFWLLSSLTRPDGAAIGYGYDTAGNLTSVTLPPNNGTPPSFSDGVAPVQTYGYENSGTRSYLAWAASPRWSSAPGGCSGDLKTGCGAYLLFRYAYGATPTTTSLTELDRYGFMDPTPTDGTGTPIQPMPGGGSAVATAPALSEYYTLGQLGTTATPTFRDSDGHATNWVTDALGRPTQTQECATTQNQQCTGTPLLTGETWDSSNNLTAEVDARGYQTDYAYDANGNTVASAAPLTTIATTAGSSTGRPTRLYSYDSFNNVMAFCDETWAHGNGRDWNVTGNPGSSDGLCPQQAGTTRMAFGYPSYEPFGELQSMTGPATASAPSGYTHHFTYDPAQQGGTDFGLPTLVQGDPIAQLDTTTRTPQQSFWYDGSGMLRCYSKGVGKWVLSYDSLGRLTSAADPDDSSANASSACGKATGQPQWNTQTTSTYYPNGQAATSQSPAERVMGVSSAFTYDLDGNELSESHHYTCTQTCAGTTISKWYDGEDRLVEVALPHDVNDFYSFAWLTRYVYDITGGQGTAIANQPVTAHGGLFKTQEWNTAPGASTPSWLDIKGNAFDALDRTTAKYAFQPGTNGTLTTASLAYDADGARAGLLSSTTNGEAESATYGYDERGNVSTISFSNAANATPNRTYGYDANGRRTLEGSAMYGTKSSAYDAAGNLAQVREATGGGVSSPATISYDLYPDGTRRGLGVASALLTASQLIAYSYRADGAMSSTALTYAGQSYGFDLLTYTDAGRPLLRKDPFSGKPIPYPAAPVNAGATYAPTTWSYDSSGQLSGHGMPYAYAYSTISHDAEGHMLGWHTALPSYGDVSMRLSNSNRGENVGTVLSTTTYGGISSSSVQLSHGAPVEANFHTPTIDNLDPYTGAITALHGYTEHDPYGDGVTTADCPSPNTLAATYDRAGRMRTHIVTVFDNTPINCGSDDRASSASGYGYDVEDHTAELSGDFANCIGWGGDGKIATVTATLCGQATTGTATDTLHFDGAQILFVTDSVAGGATQLGSIRLGLFGTLVMGSRPTFVVEDRDTTGTLVTSHSDLGYSGVKFGTKVWQVATGQPGKFDGGGGSYTNRVGVAIAASTNNGQVSNGYSSGVASYAYDGTDGFTINGKRFQGVRMMDNETGRWTTPDAYAGDVHDPMSQKPFMWNRNNPYQYADPSGFDTILLVARPAKRWDFFQNEHTFIEVHDDKGGLAGRFSFGPDKDGELRLMQTSYDAGWVSDKRAFSVKTLGTCSGICTLSKGGFDEASLSRNAKAIDALHLKYGFPFPNSNSAATSLCTGGGGGSNCSSPGGEPRIAPGWGHDLLHDATVIGIPKAMGL